MKSRFQHILHADQYAVVRMGVRALLNRLIPSATIVAVNDLRAVKVELQNAAFDLAILELPTSLSEALTVVHGIQRDDPSLPILIYTASENSQLLVKLIQVRVQAIVLKSDPYSEFASALESLAGNQKYYSSGVMANTTMLTNHP